MKIMILNFLMILLIAFGFHIPITAAQNLEQDGIYTLVDTESGYASDSLFAPETSWEEMRVTEFSLIISDQYAEFSFKAEGIEYKETGIVTERTEENVVYHSENGEFSLYTLDQEEFHFVSSISTPLHTGELFYWMELFLKRAKPSMELETIESAPILFLEIIVSKINEYGSYIANYTPKNPLFISLVDFNGRVPTSKSKANHYNLL